MFYATSIKQGIKFVDAVHPGQTWYCFHPWCPDGRALRWVAGKSMGCIAKTVRCKMLTLGTLVLGRRSVMSFDFDLTFEAVTLSMKSLSWLYLRNYKLYV